MQLLEQLVTISPTTFENVTYDLLSSMGLVDLVWRTPGADGGRDIEGDIHKLDFSSTHIKERWYVECKRYSNSIDWPTVHEKLSYADNHSADYLLFVTTATFSPKCTDEVAKWNRNKKFPQVRFWPGYELEERLSKFPKILLKHGLVSTAPIQAPAFLDLTMQIAKATTSALGRDSLMTVATENKELTYSAALSELLLARMQQFDSQNRTFAEPLVLPTDAFEWTSFASDKYPFDRYAFRAFLTLLHLVSESQNIRVSEVIDQQVVIEADLFTVSESTATILRMLAFWGHFEFELHDRRVTVKNAKN